MIKRAFTLSEVLVTLGIIGVVSALTIPTMMKNHQRHINVVQLKKVYSELSQTLRESMIENKAVSLIESGTFDDGVEPFFNKYFEKSKICNGYGDCFASKYKDLSGNVLSLSQGNDMKCAVLADSAVICISDNDWQHNFKAAVIDTNGKQGPNIGGRDFFSILIHSDARITSQRGYGGSHGTNIEYGNALEKIIQDGWEMNY